MMVDPEDGVCRECSGTLQLIDFDDCSMTVRCRSCSQIYQVESDAFNDGCMTYWFPLMLKRKLG
jgi:hypothetical protein